MSKISMSKDGKSKGVYRGKVQGLGVKFKGVCASFCSKEYVRGMFNGIECMSKRVVYIQVIRG